MATATMFSDRWIDLPRICWRQWRTERALRRRGIDFRSTDPRRVQDAYSRMSPEEFGAINSRHAWANARTMRGSLAGLLPEGPIDALDLGSGNGASTRILARLLPAGSRILGLEFADSLVEIARRQSYLSAKGRPQNVAFQVASITERFVDADGNAIADGSVHLVNASGILGHHLDEADVARTLDEVARVLAAGGIAALDVGPKLSKERLTHLMHDRGLADLRRSRGHPLDRTGQVVFRK